MASSGVNELLLKALQASRSALQEPEDGYKTANQWAKEWGKSLAWTSQIIRYAPHGAFIKKTFTIQTGRGPYPVPHYKQTLV